MSEAITNAKRTMFRVRFACGATAGRLAEDPTPTASHRRKDGAARYAVADTDTEIERPTMPDGSGARCMFDCPAKARQSGRKRTQCFPVDGAEAFKRWRYVVTCYGATESYEELQ